MTSRDSLGASSNTGTGLSRRTVLRRGVHIAALAAAAATLPVLAACSSTPQQEPVRGATDEPRPLPIPPLDEGIVRDNTRHFQLQAQAGHFEVIAGNPHTRTWGFNGPFLGPTLRARRGETIAMEVENTLPEMTTVHWHGMHLPAYADGGPHSPIDSAARWRPRWQVDQPALTAWYHPHPHLNTEAHAYRGLAGVFLIDDENSEALAAAGIPSDYGVDDIPVVIMDVAFDSDGQFDHSVDPTVGRLGTTPVVNGITRPFFQASTSRIRLRVLNGASMRFYNLALSTGEQFHVIATDQGLLPNPQPRTELLVGPGERVELLVEVPPQQTITLVSVPREDNFGLPAPDGKNIPDFGFGHSFDIVELRGAPTQLAAAPQLPSSLGIADDAPVAAAGTVVEREFSLSGFRINGELMDMERIDLSWSADEPQIWIVRNDNTDWPHNFHIHNARFQVMELSGTDIEVPTMGWRDVVSLPPGAAAKLWVEFGYYPDNTIAYMYHCHMLLHEDEGMMGQFVILNPGEQPDVRVTELSLNEKVAQAVAGGHGSHGAMVGRVDASRSVYASR